MKLNLLCLFFYLINFFTTVNSFSQIVGITPFVSGINQPIDIKHCGDDRLFVADRAGKIRVINANGSLLPIAFLDITSKISSATNSEEGFLGFTFSPDYKTDRKFYVNYTSYVGSQLTTVIEEYKVSLADSNIADVSSALTILTQAQPFSNHNGGNMMFGKDGYLYINFGDGGSGGDPLNNAQNKTSLLGKILRIDIRNSSAAQPYTIPSTNPFYTDVTGIKKEIWAYGLRNPWRSSFDRITGDLWMADVGESNREEIDFEQANSTGGGNYGWKIMEGTACYSPPVACSNNGLLLPLYDYSHSAGRSITGGYVYRSAQSKALFGMYIFADFVQKWIDGLRQNGGSLYGGVTRLITAAAGTGNPVSFGEDRYGDLYILFFNNNTIYKISDTSSTRRPKAYFTITMQSNGTYLLQGLQGRNINYQWLKNGLPVAGETSPDYFVSTAGTYNLKVTNMLNFSDTSDAFVFGALPVLLINFTAQRQSNNTVVLKWQTTSEQNNSGFVVQRRTNSQSNFSNLSFIATGAANGNSSSPLNYNFIDSAAPPKQKLYYRLQIKNRDGSFFYSDIIIVTGNSSAAGYSAYPNPAHAQTIIYFDEFTQPLQLSIFDELGRRIKVQPLSSQMNTIPLNGLKGIYILQVTDNNGKNLPRKKLVVL